MAARAAGADSLAAATFAGLRGRKLRQGRSRRGTAGLQLRSTLDEVEQHVQRPRLQRREPAGGNASARRSMPCPARVDRQAADERSQSSAAQARDPGRPASATAQPAAPTAAAARRSDLGRAGAGAAERRQPDAQAARRTRSRRRKRLPRTIRRRPSRRPTRAARARRIPGVGNQGGGTSPEG